MLMIDAMNPLGQPAILPLMRGFVLARAIHSSHGH
jgi:hypothetical protein